MPSGRRLLAKALGLLLGIAVFAPALSTVGATAAHADPASEEAQFVALTNQLRAEHGLSQLASYGPLVSIARNWSANMARAGDISHNMNLPNMVSAPWTKLGENVGVGGAPDVIQQAFINSPHHYENLIDPVWNYVGIGVVDSGGRVWVTVDFMQLNSAPATTAPAPRVVARPRTPAPAAAPSPASQTPASTPPPTAPPAAPQAPMEPTPALILALEQVRAADR
ncbi:MAG: CAP domain-containing protein [Acidimicrobiia bacterium]|nr:CAP domain-containing protein [Acidimicrobiia bacterium]